MSTALRIVKPGKGMLAALRHACPHCSAPQGVRCTTPSKLAREHVHNMRMNLVRTTSTGATA